MHPTLIPLGDGGVGVHTYGVMIVLGFVGAVLIGWRRGAARGISADLVFDYAIWGLVGGLLGARLLFIIVNWEQYAKNPLSVFQFWKGGLVFYGAALGGLFALLLFILKKKLPLKTGLELTDAMMVGAPFASGMGRVGCYFGGCCWGRDAFVVENGAFVATAPWTLQFPKVAVCYQVLLKRSPPEVVELMQSTGLTGPLLPIQLIDVIGQMILCLFLYVLHRKGAGPGRILLTWALIYPLWRSTLELFRGDTERGWLIENVLSTSQFISILVAGAAFVGLVLLKKYAPRAASTDRTTEPVTAP